MAFTMQKQAASCGFASASTRPALIPRAPVPAARRSARRAQVAPLRTATLQVPLTTSMPVPEQTEPALVIVPGHVLPINAPDIDNLLRSAGQRLVVVDVYTAWCGPCKMIAPELEKMAAELGEKLVMCKLDCTSNPDNKKWAMAQSVKALPTFIFFKEGKRVNDMTGAKAANLRKLIEACM